jgi:hypothetical protein
MEDQRDELYRQAREVADEINRRVDDYEAWPGPFAIPATGQARISVSIEALRTLRVVR